MARDRASRPEARPVRLFVAVDLPDALRELLAEAVRPWRERFPRARWVPPENWHVTLKFLGSTWPRLLGWVSESLSEIAASGRPYETSLSGLGAFPSARRARVLWCGLEDPGGWFPALVRAIDGALSREFKPESRAFTPHLTVARSQPPIALPEQFTATELRSDPFVIDRLVLYRSHLQRPAPRYEALEEFPLGAVPGSP